MKAPCRDCGTTGGAGRARGFCRTCASRHRRAGTYYDYPTRNRCVADVYSTWHRLTREGYTREEIAQHLGMRVTGMMRAVYRYRSRIDATGVCIEPGCDGEAARARRGLCRQHYYSWTYPRKRNSAAPLPSEELVELRRRVGVPDNGPTAQMTARWRQEERENHEVQNMRALAGLARSGQMRRTRVHVLPGD